MVRTYDPPEPYRPEILRAETKKLLLSGIPALGVMVHDSIYRDMTEVEEFICWLDWVRQKPSLIPLRVGVLMDQLRRLEGKRR